MARNQFNIDAAITAKLTIEDMAGWLASNDYSMVDFEEGSFEIITIYAGKSIYYRLTENKGFKTFYKQDFGGSILVFEINLKGDNIAVECYAPLMLFGFLKLELSFKEKASWITKYRKEGFKDMTNLKQFINNRLKREKQWC